VWANPTAMPRPVNVIAVICVEVCPPLHIMLSRHPQRASAPQVSLCMWGLHERGGMGGCRLCSIDPGTVSSSLAGRCGCGL